MKVSDVMEKTVITVHPQTSYKEAAKLMHDHKITGLPVVTEDQAVVGMISEKDLFRAMYPRYEEFLDDHDIDQEAQETSIEALAAHPVVEYMARHVMTIGSNAPILKAGGLMLAHGVHRLPVVDDGRLVGIVCREDIYRAIFNEHFGFSN
ncbi:MAG TPA: CBS domain-containing protein [Candidatus Paceibacterota bacterium]|nr:CBS domain-containing protein [Candidatus Paceibacterota bacterium]